jgi:hypothetical protein
MVNPVLTSFLVADIIFLATGVLLIAAASVWRAEMAVPATEESVGRLILLQGCPLVG